MGTMDETAYLLNFIRVLSAMLARYADIRHFAVNVRGDREAWELERLNYLFGLGDKP